MTSRRPSPFRAARSMLFALVATLLAVMGHALGGGGLPDPAVTLVVAALLGGTAGPLLERSRGFTATLGGLAVAQLLFHSLFLVAGHDMGGIDLPRMLLFHAVAATVTALVLSSADAAAAKVGRAVRRLVRTLLLPNTAGVTVRLTAGVRTTAPVTARHSGPATRRGPPTLA